MVQRISAIAPRRAGFADRLYALLGPLFRRAEPVAIVEQRFNFLPRSFRWRGDLRRVRHIARVWDCAHIGRRAPRRYFEVVCQDGGICVLFQDLNVGTWHLSL
jgi:hypothetical protein